MDRGQVVVLRSVYCRGLEFQQFATVLARHAKRSSSNVAEYSPFTTNALLVDRAEGQQTEVKPAEVVREPRTAIAAKRSVSRAARMTGTGRLRPSQSPRTIETMIRDRVLTFNALSRASTAKSNPTPATPITPSSRSSPDSSACRHPSPARTPCDTPAIAAARRGAGGRGRRSVRACG